MQPLTFCVIAVYFFARGISTFDPKLSRAELDDLQKPTRKGFVAVEWGGMNLNGFAMTR